MKQLNNYTRMNTHNKLQIVLSLFVFILFSSVSYGAEICDNGIDDDNDGLIDCGDQDCYGESTCADAFECSNSLYQVITKDLKALDVASSSYELINSASNNYNGAGFNVQDGFIYGINKSGSNYNLYKIANSGPEENLGPISNFGGLNYAGDFDTDGNLYTYKSGSFPALYHVDVNATPLVHVMEPLTNLHGGSIPGAADITYNPVLNKFLGLSSTQKIIVIDPDALTIDLINIPSGIVTTKGAFGAAYSDVEGNTYFSNNTDGRIFKVVLDANTNFETIVHVANGEPTNSNDGMSCSQGLPPFETSCTDGVDNDGDGLVDCADADCFVDASCPIISAELFCQPESGPNGIVPFYLRLVNNSQADATDFSISEVLPFGFSFLSDTLSFGGTASQTDINQRPIDGNRNTITWSTLNIPVGDTLEISYSVLVDSNAPEGNYMDSVSASGVLLQPGFISHTINILNHNIDSPAEFICEPAFYQVYKKRGEPNVFAKLDIASGEYEEIATISHQANGLGFDYNTGLAYGSEGKLFISLDHDGVVTNLGKLFSKNVYVGDMDTLGNWYGKVGGDIVKIQISNLGLTTYYGQGMPGWDMAYNKDGNFYAVHNNTLYKYNTSTNLKSTVGPLTGDTVPGGGFGAQWTGSDGMLYISHNSSGKIYRVNITDGESKLMMITTSGLQYNDGFSCPTQLPAPLTFDYGDNAHLPSARLFTYSQSTDNVPNLDGVWAGSKINYEALDLSNDGADGDLYDDGLTYPTLLKPDSTVTFQISLNANYNQTAHYGLWIDWNADMVADSFYTGSKLISGIDQIDLPIEIPSNFADGFISVRLMVAEGTLTESDINIQSSMTGEVEDYYFYGSSTINCSDGLDDDMDGLIDCDDPDCYDSCKYTDTKSAYEGGLESNGRLSHKISATNFDKKMGRIADRSRRSQQRKINKSTFYQDAKNLKNGSQASIRSFIPLDVIPNTTTTESSPEHLISITNATDIFSIDIYDDMNPDSRKGAVLGLTSTDGVYEHTKYVCDRLAGSSILDVLTYTVDLGGSNHQLIIPKLELAEGSVEYATSFSVRDTLVNGVDQYIFESHWNLDDYTKNVGYHNFQVWAGNTRDLELLVKEIYRLLTDTNAANGSGRDIAKYTIGTAPVFFINNAQYVDDSLILQVTNKANLSDVLLDGEYSLTETMDMQDFNHTLSLNGDQSERVALNVGRVFDMGLTFYHQSLNVRDAIFLADGTWNTSYDDFYEDVDVMTITPGSNYSEDRFEVDRNIDITGSVRNYITIYRSFNPNFTGIDLDSFETVSFTISGSGTIELAAVKESIDDTDWALQGKYLIELTEEPKTYHLTKEHFKNINGVSQDWSDLFMMVFTVVGDGHNSVDFDIAVSEMFFGNENVTEEFMVYTDESMITPVNGGHAANQTDGTDRGEMPVSTDFSGDTMEVYIKNLGDIEMSLEDMFIDAPNNHFELVGFEPQLVAAGDVVSLQIRYSPDTYPVQSVASVVITIDGTDEYSFQLLGQATCPSIDLVETADILKYSYGISKEYKSSDLLQANAEIDSGRSILFKGGQSVELLNGFEIQAGSSIDVIIQDDCSID